MHKNCIDLNEPISRELVCDGKFLYNVGYELVLNKMNVEKKYCEPILVGVIDSNDTVEIPTTFLNKKIKLILSLKTYRKGKNYPKDHEGFFIVPIGYRPWFWWFMDETIPDPSFVEEIRSEIKTLILGNSSLIEKCFIKSSYENIIFGNAPRIIPTACFSGSESLKKCELTTGVSIIGPYSFYGCTSLEDINLPDSVTEIGMHAFDNTGLREIIIPPFVERIKRGGFSNCKRLRTVVIPPSVKYINPAAFEGSCNVKIIAFKNSYAAHYAVEKGINFEYFEQYADNLLQK